MFNNQHARRKKIFIDFEWKGPVKTLTREYTGISLCHVNSGNVCTDSPELVDLEVCLHYRKCSTQEFRFLYDASHARFVQSPVYLGDAEDKFGIRLSINQDDEQRFKLTIKNQTDINSTRIMIKANVCPAAVNAVNEDNKHRINI